VTVMIGKQEGAPTEEVFPELTRDAIDRMSNAKSARLQDVMEVVIRHLHAIVREAKITQGEWWQAIDFLTHAGQMCSESRQELILLSDILGISMLVDAVDNVAGPGISDSTVLGPFYAGHQRELAQGDSILLREEASEPLAMSGRVTDPEGQPVADALIEVWQTAPNQLYDVQDTDQPQGHLRASFVPIWQVPIDSEPSCRSVIQFQMTVPQVNCSRQWDDIRSDPRTFIS
jgi:hypothetical protein